MSTPSLYVITLSATVTGDVPVLAGSEREARRIARQVAGTWGGIETPQGHRLRVAAVRVTGAAHAPAGGDGGARP